jgi:flagella basal body P-ring formation protein FlgA
VRRAQLVRRGDLVQLQVKKGAVVARSTAIAAEDGMFGERIRVTTASSKRELTAVVVGRESVEVVLERNR